MNMIDDDGGAHPVKTAGAASSPPCTKDGTVMIKDGQGNVASVTIADVDQSDA